VTLTDEDGLIRVTYG